MRLGPNRRYSWPWLAEGLTKRQKKILDLRYIWGAPVRTVLGKLHISLQTYRKEIDSIKKNCHCYVLVKIMEDVDTSTPTYDSIVQRLAPGHERKAADVL